MRHPTGQLMTIAVAIGVSLLAVTHGGTWALSDWGGWPALSIIILVAAWVNVLAWLAERWGLVIVCSLLTFGAPWGFIYPGILAGPTLAILATSNWARKRRLPRNAI
jgi:hypothetical protein